MVDACPSAAPDLHRPGKDAALLITRLRRVIGQVVLDCDCQKRLDESIARFSEQEERRIARWQLSEARNQKQRIVAILHFLLELDRITENDADPTIFEEIALIFDEVGAAATLASKALRSIPR